MGKTADLTVVQKTIIDTLHKEPLLNHRKRQRRLSWAKEKKKWPVAQWSKVLF
ncbi:Midasin [Labeo rohita]|uniref:Midasin n=1 Tax=Labeo rohita TaxID=84645 RepID=A0ABQ8LNU4_LABRO|nr:Midasin [Labeo rohita]